MNTQSCFLVSVRIASLQKPNGGDFRAVCCIGNRMVAKKENCLKSAGNQWGGRTL